MNFRCAVCDAPVQRVWKDMSLVRDEFYYTVQCHGQTEVVTVRDEGVVIQRALEGAPFLLTKETP